MSHSSTFSLPRVLCGALLAAGGLGLGGFWAWQNWFGRANTTVATVTIAPPLIPKTVQAPGVRFTDITNKAGIRFRHTNGAFGKKLLPETMGSGVAFLDYDGDGRQDILFVNSCSWPGYVGQVSNLPGRRQVGNLPHVEPAPTLALYRNKGDSTFEDVTAAAGL